MSRLVIGDNGEILTSMNEGDRIVRAKSKEYLNGTIELNAKEDFIKVYTKTLFDLSKSLSGTESQFVNYLLQYISYNDGILKHCNGRVLKVATMSHETGLAEDTVRRILRSLVSKQILGKHKTGRDIKYTVNPFIFMKGTRVNKTLYSLFKNTKWAKL